MIDKGQTYYLAGPMSGRPMFNFPMFEAVAAMLRKQGFQIVSPNELDAVNTTDYELARDSVDGSLGTTEQTWGDFLARDVKIVADQVDGVICLPGWEQSRGARLEAFVATCQGKPVFQYDAEEHGVYRVSAKYVGHVLRDYIEQHYEQDA